MRDETTKASRRHAWSAHSLSDAYEAGFMNGAAFAVIRVNEEIKLLHSYFVEELPRENAEEIFNTVKESLKRLL